MIELFPSRSVFISIFGLSVYWYGIMYLLAFITAFYLVQRLQKYRSIDLSHNDWSNILTWFILAVVVGGRVGYTLLYSWNEFVKNPLIVFAIRDGGMSSHGGFVAVILVILYVVHRYKVSILAFGDIVIIPIAIGLAFGRFGNFINLELYGTVTQLPWAISIPGVEGLRHPTQLYAFAKDLTIASLCFTLLRREQRLPDGFVSAVFLLSYAVLRFIVEIFRVPTHSSFAIGSLILTRGQLYSIPIFLFGLVILVISLQKTSSSIRNQLS